MPTQAALAQPDTQLAGTGGTSRLRALLLRRIWLPRLLYALVPWVYLASGVAALLGGLFLPDSSWVVPYAILLALACLHAGIAIAGMRHRHRAARQPAPGG